MARVVVQLLLLLLAVPAQYFISLWINPNPSGNSVEVLRLVDTLQNFGKKWTDPKNWLIEAQKLWDKLFAETGECIAVEVMKYRSNAGHFAQSVVPRDDRPDQLKYHIGQVFQHKSKKYHGVIIGWDKQAKAPDQWLEVDGGIDNMKHLLPHYAVLIDKKESSLTRDYISQEDIEIVTNVKITNRFIDDYFELYDGVVYTPRQFLKELYPKD